MTRSELKREVCRHVDLSRSLMYELADYLHEHPEVGTQETMSSAYLRRMLSAAGFDVADLVPDEFPTAFHAVRGSGPFQMGFLAEYDALPRIGHGCGHNLIAAMSVGAALAFAAVCGDAATVHVYGCPAEETVGSKVYMSDCGVFDCLDAALIVHPAADRTSIGGTSYASHPLEITFHGKGGHIADKDYAHVNALDALVDFYSRLRAMEGQWKAGHLLGMIITEGGAAPNIVPDKASLRATIRSLDTAYLEDVMLPQIRSLGEEVARRHGAAVDMVHYEPLYKNMISDPKIDSYFAAAFRMLGEEFSVYDSDYADGSSDVGNVSHVTRASQPEICIGCHIAAHTEEFAAAAGSEFAKAKAVVGAKAMAMAAVDIMLEDKPEEK